MKIRVLIVDDSAFMRVTLTKIIESEEIVVCGTARDGIDAMSKIPLFQPNVIMLDVQMPNMDGIECLKRIMALPKKIPVIMFSSITTEGADVTLEAMDIGAVDFITKPSKAELESIERLRYEIHSKIKTAARINLSKLSVIKQKVELEKSLQKELTLQIPDAKTPAVRQIVKEQAKVSSYPEKHKSNRIEICLIGTSTGGPPALQNVFEKIPSDFPVGIIVVQHMPVGFTKSLADRLNNLSKIQVKESQDGDVVKPGLGIVAQAGYQIDFQKHNNNIIVKHRMPKQDDLFKPAVNDMYFAAAKVFKPENIMCVIMTGMGNDGLLAIRELKKQGAYIIAESEESAVVFGMPGVVVKENLADKIAPIWEIGNEIIQYVNKSRL